MSEDEELEAIRAKLRAQLLRPEPRATASSAGAGAPVDLMDAQLAAFLQQHPAVLVDVWAPWCGPCRIIAPMIEDLAKSYAGRVAFAKMNADDNPGVMDAFGIQGIPTLLLFRDGRLVDRIVGVAPKPHLAAAVERLAGRRE